MNIVDPAIEEYMLGLLPSPDPVRAEMERLGGLFICDNMLWSGRVLENDASEESTGGIRDLSRMLGEAADFATTLILIRDGVSVSVKLSD